jgi:GntR family transcriptional regulator
MDLCLNRDDPRPAHQQIVEEVQRALVLGTLRPGDPLPPVRHLAADLRVNPGAVARAYRSLEDSGVVVVRWGEGPFVAVRDGTAAERRAVTRRVVERALAEARRNGITAEELMQALRDEERGA